MSHLPFHPAPGLGDMAPGWFALPQNPLTQSDSTVLVPTIQATAPGRVVRFPTLADLVQASFAVPQNPVRTELAMSMAGLKGLGCGGMGCGCPGFGCDGGKDFYALNGLGQTPGTDPVSQWLAGTGSIGTTLADDYTLAGITLPTWGWIAAAGAAFYVATDLFGKGAAGTKRLAGRAGKRLSQYSQNPKKNVYQFWTDNGHQANIRASSKEEASRIAARKISRREWNDGTWGYVKGPDGQMKTARQGRYGVSSSF